MNCKHGLIPSFMFNFKQTKGLYIFILFETVSYMKKNLARSYTLKNIYQDLKM